MFCFSGTISQNLLIEIGDSLKNKLKQREENNSTIIKVFSIFVEQAQNILHYSAEKEQQITENNCGNGVVLVGREALSYYVLCGNFVENQIVPRLQQQLSALQEMSKEELKVYYKEQRKKDAPETSKGAGLGFIELARKASQPLEFDFQTVNTKFSFFALKVII